jgi:hypothetical protein
MNLKHFLYLIPLFLEFQFKDQSRNLVLCSSVDVAHELCEMLKEQRVF